MAKRPLSDLKEIKQSRVIFTERMRTWKEAVNLTRGIYCVSSIQLYAVFVEWIEEQHGHEWREVLERTFPQPGWAHVFSDMYPRLRKRGKRYRRDAFYVNYPIRPVRLLEQFLAACPTCGVLSWALSEVPGQVGAETLKAQMDRLENRRKYVELPSIADLMEVEQVRADFSDPKVAGIVEQWLATRRPDSGTSGSGD